MKLVILGFFLLPLFGCHKSEEAAQEHKRVIKIEEIPEDFRVPSKFWEQVQNKLTEDQEDTIIFLPISLKLKEKNPGILKSEELTIQFPRGGGTVDLSQWVNADNGTFFVQFDLSEFESFEKVDVYFLSLARKRKIDSEILGMGCNKFVKLKQPFVKMITKEGLAVNTTRNRHLSVVGGRWVVVARDAGNKIYISQITLTDTNEKDLFCKESAAGTEKE